MSSRRGKGGQFEEVRVGPMADVERLLGEFAEKRKLEGEGKETAAPKPRSASYAKMSVAEQMADDIMNGRPLAPEAREPNWMAPHGHEYDHHRTGEKAARVARRSSLQPEILAPMSQRVGVTFTLKLVSVESLGRLALVRDVKRGQILDELIAVAAEAEFGEKSVGKKR